MQYLPQRYKIFGFSDPRPTAIQTAHCQLKRSNLHRNGRVLKRGQSIDGRLFKRSTNNHPNTKRAEKLVPPLTLHALHKLSKYVDHCWQLATQVNWLDNQQNVQERRLILD